MWGWLGAIVKGIAGAFFDWLREKERDRLLVREAEERLAREDAERKVKEHEAVADVRSRDLGADPGVRVQRKDKRAGDEPPSGPA